MKRLALIALLATPAHADDNPGRTAVVTPARVAKAHRQRPVPSSFRRSFAHQGLVPTLAAKVAEIETACGSRMTSGVRHTWIAGTRRMSLHASGQAVDLVGNPGCIYAHLKDAAWGYSTDYAAVLHVHVADWRSREAGHHFAHNSFTRRRFAARRVHRVA